MAPFMDTSVQNYGLLASVYLFPRNWLILFAWQTFESDILSIQTRKLVA